MSRVLRLAARLRRTRAIAVLAGLLAAGVVLRADEGWVIQRLDIKYDIQRDGRINVAEAIDVDFRGLSKHGIARDLIRRQIFDRGRYRDYDIDLVGVLDARGERHQVAVLDEGDTRRFRIGDPDRTVSGPQTYRIAYQLGGVLNGFADHDEYYWNATGRWPVTIERATIRVLAPDSGIQRVECFQGVGSSTDRCDARFAPGEAVFTATRPLAEQEEMAVVVGLRKGVVREPVPNLSKMPRSVFEFFGRTPVFIAGSTAEVAMLTAVIAVGWWRLGRDRRYIALQRAPAVAGGQGTPAEEPIPLFGGRPIAVEFTPPEGLRPAQMGLLLDERADTLDVTATIVDLAVRGHLKIAEVDKAHWFSRKDWQLERLKTDGKDLLPYERIVLDGLFESGSVTTLSALKNKFYDDLRRARSALYKDAVERRWFPQNPNTVRAAWTFVGLVIAGGGIALTVWLGRWWGAGLLGLPVVVAGLLLGAVSRAMPRRTALGQNLTRRTLGFLRYIKTAEAPQQAFAERAHIFTEYLPYAIAFRCVDRWARAFRDVDLQRATTSWYSGTSQFDPGTFSSSFGNFSSSLSSSISSTPGGSGSSGFSGGSAGGGGGGGGGGSW
ncbi:MAG: DUF2207 domain-containing protein [Acidobacteria bacterium]|nr:DUF2207 domain-containing protein [Acidobacteriota bacterium]